MNNQKIIKKELEEVIEKYNLADKFSAEDVISWAADEDDPDVMRANREYQRKWLGYFAKIENMDELNRILQIFTNAWNYFPHKSLNGKSPIQMTESRK